MEPMTILAIGLTLIGAVCFAVASVLQHHAVTTTEHPDVTGRVGEAGRVGEPIVRRPLNGRHLMAIIRRRRWLEGAGLAAIGAIVNGIALLMAPLRVVQPVGVLAVPLAVLLSAAKARRRPSVGVLLGAALTVGGVAVFVVASAGSATSHTPSATATLTAGGIVAVLVAVLAALGLARHGEGPLRCLALASAVATAYGLLAALVRVAAEAAADTGILSPLVLGCAAGALVAFAVGAWLVQHAYHAGAPEIVIACLTVVDPMVAVVLGAVLLGEGASTPVGAWVLLGAAALTATVGVLTLAHHHPDAVAARAEREGSTAVRA
jgi:drug/metabolite transporter (DMT)-like permease